MEQEYVLGLDVGTSTVKAVLIGKGCGGGAVQTSSQALGGQHAEVAGVEGARERPVRQLWDCLEACVSGLDPCKLQRVCAVGVCGQMHGCVLWNEGLRGADCPPTPAPNNSDTHPCCTNLITWQDGRCSPEFLSSLPRSGQPVQPSAGYGCATLAWLQRHYPEVVQGFSMAGTIMDLVVWRLCRGGGGAGGGAGQVLMSAQNAVSWGYFDMETSQWEEDILRDAGFPVQLLPRVVHAPSLAGTLSTCWHHIPQGTCVGVAMGDLQCSVLATKPSPNDAILNVGSASQLGVVKPGSSSSHFPLPASVMAVPYFHSDQLLVAASLSGANTLATLVESVKGWMRDLGVEEGSIPTDSDLYERMVELASRKLDTSLSLQVTLWGERHAPTLTGGAVNVRTENLSMGDICSAALKGMVENLRSMMSDEIFQSLQIKRLLGSGSALQRNPVLRHYIEAVFNLPLVIRDSADAPLGAAMAAEEIVTG